MSKQPAAHWRVLFLVFGLFCVLSSVVLSPPAVASGSTWPVAGRLEMTGLHHIAVEGGIACVTGSAGLSTVGGVRSRRATTTGDVERGGWPSCDERELRLWSID